MKGWIGAKRLRMGMVFGAKRMCVCVEGGGGGEEERGGGGRERAKQPG